MVSKPACPLDYAMLKFTSSTPALDYAIIKWLRSHTRQWRHYCDIRELYRFNCWLEGHWASCPWWWWTQWRAITLEGKMLGEAVAWYNIFLFRGASNGANTHDNGAIQCAFSPWTRRCKHRGATTKMTELWQFEDYLNSYIHEFCRIKNLL